MLCYPKVGVTLSCVWVFLTEEFNSYVKSTLFGLKCSRKIAYGMLCYPKIEVTFSCVWVFLTKEFNYYVKSTLLGLKC